MTPRLTLATALLTGLLAVLPSSPARAQDVQITGPLAGAPACRHCRLYRVGRFQVQPTVGFTLQDEFSRTILFGAQANYHFTDWLGIGGFFQFGGVHIDTGLTDQVTLQGQTTTRNRLSLPGRELFPEQIGVISWIAGGQLSFIPLRGKLALFQKLFIDADFYVAAGVAAIGIEERADVGGGVCGMMPSGACDESQVTRASRVAVTGTFAAGLMLYANDFFGVSVEWRALPFAWNTSGTDEAGAGPDEAFPDGQIDSGDRIFHFNHMVNLGFAFYLPIEATTSE